MIFWSCWNNRIVKKINAATNVSIKLVFTNSKTPIIGTMEEYCSRIYLDPKFCVAWDFEKCFVFWKFFHSWSKLQWSLNCVSLSSYCFVGVVVVLLVVIVVVVEMEEGRWSERSRLQICGKRFYRVRHIFLPHVALTLRLLIDGAANNIFHSIGICN